MIASQRCLHKNAGADGLCAGCRSPLTPDWAAVGQGLHASQTAWPVASMGVAAGPTIARSPLETANPTQTGSAGLALPRVATSYERAPLAPSAPSGVPSSQRDSAPRICQRMTNGKHFELAVRASYLIGRRDSSDTKSAWVVGESAKAGGRVRPASPLQRNTPMIVRSVV